MKPRILVIDDNPDVLLILEVRLHRAGFEVLTAGDREAALALARSHEPGLVLVDLDILEMSGSERAAADWGGETAPMVYAMTDNGAHASHGEIMQCLGAECVVSKTQALARDFPSYLLGRLSSVNPQSLHTETLREAEPALAA